MTKGCQECLVICTAEFLTQMKQFDHTMNCSGKPNIYTNPQCYIVINHLGPRQEEIVSGLIQGEILEAGSSLIPREGEAGSSPILGEGEAGLSSIPWEGEAGSSSIPGEGEAGSGSIPEEGEAGSSPIPEGEAGSSPILGEGEAGSTLSPTREG